MYVLGNSLYENDGTLLGKFSKHIAATYAMWTINGDSNGLGYRMLNESDLLIVQGIIEYKQAQQQPVVSLAVYETAQQVAQRIINEVV